MVEIKHTENGKVKEKFKSRYTAKEIKDFEEDLSVLSEKELLILMIKELRKVNLIK